LRTAAHERVKRKREPQMQGAPSVCEKTDRKASCYPSNARTTTKREKGFLAGTGKERSSRKPKCARENGERETVLHSLGDENKNQRSEAWIKGSNVWRTGAQETRKKQGGEVTKMEKLGV